MDDDVGEGPDYDLATDLEKVVFAAPTTIVSEGFFVVTKGMGPGQHPFGLRGDGDTVTLLRPDLSVADRVSYTAGHHLGLPPRLNAPASSAPSRASAPLGPEAFAPPGSPC